ncbi:MAG: hypothetical protein JSU83_07475 [Deltaproteobacteria bacterium]|nr:MAG: hypothetical protein JSU83_07475 [Deltaproteobacteria bacterium]
MLTSSEPPYKKSHQHYEREMSCPNPFDFPQTNQRRWIYTMWLGDDTAKPFSNNTFFLVLFVPSRPFGFVHHIIGTDNLVTDQDQEIAEK